MHKDGGVYLLVLECIRPCVIEVGAIGKLYFKKGSYIYVGRCKSGIKARIERHFNRKKRIHWHIDYLTTSHNFVVKDVFVLDMDACEEEHIATLMSNMLKVIEGFGSSDTKAKGHLFYLPTDDISKIIASIRPLFLCQEQQGFHNKK